MNIIYRVTNNKFNAETHSKGRRWDAHSKLKPGATLSNLLSLIFVFTIWIVNMKFNSNSSSSSSLNFWQTFTDLQGIRRTN
jgi:hypothetical protein